MTNHTVESLLAWMRDPAHNMLWGWDCIAAMARSKTNQILIQDYIARFGSGSYLPAISGDVMMAGNDFKEVIHDFVLDAPHLSFAASGLDDAKAGLVMSVMSGLQLGMRKDGQVWQTVRLSEIDPLQGPELTLDLDLNEVPGTVGEGGDVKLDLRHSDNFNLNFALTPDAQRRGGDFFKEKFNDLPDDQRVFVIGTINPGSDEALRAQSFRLRAQRKAGQALATTAEEDEDGAILVFICMAGSEEGGGPDSAYPYLIPSDAGNDYSAAVLFSERRLQLALAEGVLDGCAEIIGTDDFDYVYDANGRLQSVVAKSGALSFNAINRTLLPIWFNNQELVITLDCTALTLPVTRQAPLTLMLSDEGLLSLQWRTSGALSTLIKYRVKGSDELVFPDDERHEQVTLDLSATYQLSIQDGDLIFQPDVWSLDVNHEDLPSRVGAEADWSWALIVLYITAQLVFLSGQMIEPRIQRYLHRVFKFSEPFNAFLKDNIQLNFAGGIQTDTLHLPRDVAAFGQINPLPSTFEIVLWKPVIKAGARQLNTVQPAVTGLVWAVEDLQRSARNPGSVTDGGVYQAPPAEAFEGRFLRVRITAIDPATGYKAAALITVVREALTVNPLIQECAKGGEVQLQAGAIGEGNLAWSILNPVTGQSGSLIVHDDNGRTCTYKATSQTIPGQTYVLDEIEVHDSVSGARRSVHVLVVLDTPGLSVNVVADASLPDDQVRFQVGSSTPAGVQWHLPLGGPGTLDSDTGLYTADPTALQRFVLVMARYEMAGLVFEGHLLLPLPLADFT